MISGLLSKIVGSQLTKNYEVDKEPYLHGGLHNLWKIYRGKKKDRNNMDVSLFIFEKKTLDKKKVSSHQKDDIFQILKKDAQNLAKLKHPNLLSLIEQPMEDQKFIIFVTEPVEYNLSSLQFDATKKDMIPGDLEIKCLSLELLEALNFLHNNAKMIHMGLAPEHLYITKDGKLKLGGLNFGQQFSTAEAINVPLNYDLRINDYAVVPNLRFAAPEISDQQQCSLNSDIFSVGTLLYYMVALNKNKSPTILNQQDISDKASHTFECTQLQKKFSSLMQGMESDFESVLRQLLNSLPGNRGPIMQVMDLPWFQDPLLKTIKYLETLDSKDHISKVQFLQGITRILEKFDKKALLKKAIPLLLDQMKIIQLSVNVLPNILNIMERPNFLTTTEFREYIWPSLQKLCKAKELPAQSLFLILKNTELFMRFVGPQEFQANFLILINKSLECGVAKLQFLALTKVPILIKQIEYNTVKTSIIPRILMILEKPAQIQLKHKTLEVINEIISIIDQQTMKDKIMKTFEKVRTSETDPQVCMLLLKIYEQMAKVLGVEEIGLKILPGIIPMLISGTFTRVQFKDMMQSVRRLLDQIEQHREKDLREMGQESTPVDGAFDMDALEKSLGLAKPTPQGSCPSVTNKDVFDFLSSLERGSGTAIAEQQPQASFGFSSPQTQQHQQQDDIMSTMNSLAQPKTQQQFGSGGDHFGGLIGNQASSTPGFTPPTFAKPQQQQHSPFNSGGGWDADLPNLGGGIGSTGVGQKQDNDFFSSLANNNKPVQQQTNFTGLGFTSTNRSSMPSVSQGGGGPMNLGGFSQSKVLGKADDPFAELLGDESSSQSQTFTGFKPPMQQQQQQPALNLGFNNQQANFSGQQNNYGSFGQPQQNNFQQQQQNNMNNFGNFGQANQFNQNQFGNFGQQQQTNNQQFGNFGAFPQPKPQNPLGASNTDDFFSQFQNPNNQQQQKPGGFGNIF